MYVWVRFMVPVLRFKVSRKGAVRKAVPVLFRQPHGTVRKVGAFRTDDVPS